MASFHVRRKDANGKPVLWGVAERVNGKLTWQHFKVEKEAKARFHELQAATFTEKAAAGANPAATRTITLSVILEAYRAAKFPECRENTKQNYNKAFAFLSVLTSIKEINTAWLMKRFGETDLSPSSRKSYLGCISRMLAWAEEVFKFKCGINWKVIYKTLCKPLERNKKKYLTDADMEKIFKWFLDKKLFQNHIMIRVMSAYGFRIRECLKMNMSQVDVHAATMTVLAGNEKSHKEKAIPVGSEFITELRASREAFRLHCEMERKPYTDPEAVFHDDVTGKRQKYSVFAKRWRQAFRDTDVSYKTVHRMRAYAFGVMYKMSGHNLELCKQVIGWDSGAYKFYVEPMLGDLNEIQGAIFDKHSNNKGPESPTLNILMTLKQKMAERNITGKELVTLFGIPGDFAYHTLDVCHDKTIRALELAVGALGYRLTISQI